MEEKALKCKSFVNRMTDGYFAMRYLPFRLTGNMYRGCTHGCVYCYAASTHYYLRVSPDEFSKCVFVKMNSPTVFEKEVKKYEVAKRRKSVIILGNISDAYQPLEMRYRLTRKILKICLEHHFPCFVETKSPLILEDLDIIQKLADENLIGVGMTVTSYNNEFTKLVEPFVPKHKLVRSENAQKERMLTLEMLSSIGVDTYLHVTPYFPVITDRDIERIIADASDSNIGNVIMAPLELSSYIWSRLSRILRNSEFASLIPVYEELYLKKGRKLGARMSTSRNNHYSLEKKVSSLCRKYGIGYWAFTNPQFNTAKLGCAYRLRYPMLVDYWNFAKENGKITYEDAIDLARNFPIDNRYIRSLRAYWLNGNLFKEIHGIQKINCEPLPYYIHKQNAIADK